MDGVRIPEDPDELPKRIYYSDFKFPKYWMADWDAEPEKRKDYYRDRARRQSGDQ